MEVLTRRRREAGVKPKPEEPSGSEEIGVMTSVADTQFNDKPTNRYILVKIDD